MLTCIDDLSDSANRCSKNTIYAYDEIEVQVREATSNEKWGAPSKLMAQIANATHNP